MRSLAAGVACVLAACGPGSPAVPVPRYDRDASGALFASFDPAQLDAFLAAHGLPAPEPRVTVVEGGSAERFVVALARVAGVPDGAALGDLGRFFHLLRRTTLADACYRRAAELQPDEAHWPHYRGDLAERAQELELALGHFDDAARVDARAVPPRVRRARVLRSLGRADQAARAAREVLALDPDALYALTELASAALDAGRLDEAERLLDRARAAWPRQRRVHVLLAKLYASNGSLQAAERARRAATAGDELSTLVIDPWMAELEARTSSILFWKTGAQELRAAGRWSDLLPVLDELDRREPGPYWTAQKVRALVELSRAEEALGLARGAATRYPESGLVHEALGLALLALRRYDEAIASCRRALELDPRSHLGHVTWAKACVGAGDAGGALSVAARLVELDPDRAASHLLAVQVRQALAAAALAEELWPEAAEHLAAYDAALDRARGLAPDDPRCEAAREWLDEARRRLRERSL